MEISISIAALLGYILFVGLLIFLINNSGIDGITAIIFFDHPVEVDTDEFKSVWNYFIGQNFIK